MNLFDLMSERKGTCTIGLGGSLNGLLKQFK